MRVAELVDFWWMSEVVEIGIGGKFCGNLVSFQLDWWRCSLVFGFFEIHLHVWLWVARVCAAEVEEAKRSVAYH